MIQPKTNKNIGDIMAVTERPRQDEDPEIESLDTVRSSETPEDIESIETNPKQTPPKAARSYKKTTAINSADTRREMTITVGGEQMTHAIGAQGDNSVMHIRM